MATKTNQAHAHKIRYFMSVIREWLGSAQNQLSSTCWVCGKIVRSASRKIVCYRCLTKTSRNWSDWLGQWTKIVVSRSDWRQILQIIFTLNQQGSGSDHDPDDDYNPSDPPDFVDEVLVECECDSKEFDSSGFAPPILCSRCFSDHQRRCRYNHRIPAKAKGKSKVRNRRSRQKGTTSRTASNAGRHV
jgi:hypothetical protein